MKIILLLMCAPILSFGGDQLVFEGDSFTDPTYHSGPPDYVTHYPALMIAALSPTPATTNFAHLGNTLTDLNSRAASVDALYSVSYAHNTLSVLIGQNDLNSESAATFVPLLKTYCLARKTTGWRILLWTLVQEGGGGAAIRTAANALMRADPSFYDALVPIDTDPNMGCYNCNTNPTYFYDGIHPSAAGQVIYSNYGMAAYRVLLGQPARTISGNVTISGAVQ